MEFVDLGKVAEAMDIARHPFLKHPLLPRDSAAGICDRNRFAVRIPRAESRVREGGFYRVGGATSCRVAPCSSLSTKTANRVAPFASSALRLT
ncbi:hypothetical protein Poly51_28430 [Rubripirellula tenax]|uniref:Uncharacterized protein n=1 Tax=Rubripirellula tenax TaxID=2528015 RepID=A0A5C6F6P5_9BACT|nr:hypothetical protein Poly51_28430 [Rubripirellula tenax]